MGAYSKFNFCKGGLGDITENLYKYISTQHKRSL